jgi:hypothetical protein
VFAELRGDANVRLSFITAYQEDQCSHLMISLCPGCHAKAGRTKAVLSQMPALLLELWREQHPFGYEQTTLDFKTKDPAADTAPLFLDRFTGHRQTLAPSLCCFGRI